MAPPGYMSKEAKTGNMAKVRPELQALEPQALEPQPRHWQSRSGMDCPECESDMPASRNAQ
jgi:hypothetical protein